MNKLRITVLGDDSVELIEQLCATTGLTPSSLIALMVRKYGKDLEQWLGYVPASPVPMSVTLSRPPPLELPTDPGEGLSPIEF